MPVLCLTGDWLAQSGRVPVLPPDGLKGIGSGQTLAFDTTGIGRWDSGLIEFLWDAKRAAIAAGASIDGATLPPSAQKLLGLLPDGEPPPPPARRRGARTAELAGGRDAGVPDGNRDPGHACWPIPLRAAR